MKTLAVLAVLALAVGGSVGCYNFGRNVADRLEEKVAAFEAKEGRTPTAEEVSTLAAEAEKEEREVRGAELDDAKRKAAEGAGALLGGNWIAGAVLLLGAGATFLGFGRKKPAPKTPEPPKPPEGVPA